MDSLERRHEGAIGVVAGPGLVADHLDLRVGDRLAVEVEVELLRIGQVRHAHGVDDGRAGLHLDLPFQLRPLGLFAGCQRDVDRVGPPGRGVAVRQGTAGLRSRDLHLLRRRQSAQAGQLAEARGIEVELGRQNEADDDDARHDEGGENLPQQRAFAGRIWGVAFIRHVRLLDG